MAERKPDLSPDHFTWLVEGRSANQRSTLEIYRLITEYDFILNGNVELYEATQKLAGVAFSLWRAVFLSDTTREFEDEVADLNTFLVSLIADNTIQYVNDKKARNWSFRYYLDNAIYRLERLSEDRLALVDKLALYEGAPTEKDRWLNAQSMLDMAISGLGIAFVAAVEREE